MPIFPRKEAEALEAARKLIGGMKNEPESLSFLAFPGQDVVALFDSFNEKKRQIALREAELRMLYGEKKSLLKELIYAVKSNLKMLARFYKNDTAQLARFGWGARRRRTPSRVPGQPRVLEALTQGADWFDLDWKPPLDGGKVRFYKILRLVEGETRWQEVGTFFKTEGRLKDQPRKLDMQFQVVAVNLAGESLPSNTVNVVL